MPKHAKKSLSHISRLVVATLSLTVIAGDNDRWLPRGVGIYEPALGIEPLIFPGAGHFSLDDGWGQWPGLISWIESGDPRDLLER